MPVETLEFQAGVSYFTSSNRDVETMGSMGGGGWGREELGLTGKLGKLNSAGGQALAFCLLRSQT